MVQQIQEQICKKPWEQFVLIALATPMYHYNCTVALATKLIVCEVTVHNYSGTWVWRLQQTQLVSMAY